MLLGWQNGALVAGSRGPHILCWLLLPPAFLSCSWNSSLCIACAYFFILRTLFWRTEVTRLSEAITFQFHLRIICAWQSTYLETGACWHRWFKWAHYNACRPKVTQLASLYPMTCWQVAVQKILPAQRAWIEVFQTHCWGRCPLLLCASPSWDFRLLSTGATPLVPLSPSPWAATEHSVLCFHLRNVFKNWLLAFLQIHNLAFSSWTIETVPYLVRHWPCPLLLHLCIWALSFQKWISKLCHFFFKKTTKI